MFTGSKGWAAVVSLFTVASSLVSSAAADERHFTYAYESDVLQQGTWEFEQWITNSSGRKDGDFTRWDMRSEFEYGLGENLSTSLYLNWRSERTSFEGEEDSSDTDFKGVSSEWMYQILNPNLDLVGLALYAEYTTDGLDHELEGKIILSKNFEDWVLALNGVYEAEWEREDRRTEEEAMLQFVGGVSYQLTPEFSFGLEARNQSAFPGGLDLNGQEFQIWSVGPAVHYGTPKWWATLTLLPQVWGNGDGSRGGRQRVHEEDVEVRLIVGVLL